MWQDGAARPMTAVRAAGYTSSLTRGAFTGSWNAQLFVWFSVLLFLNIHLLWKCLFIPNYNSQNPKSMQLGISQCEPLWTLFIRGEKRRKIEAWCDRLQWSMTCIFRIYLWPSGPVQRSCTSTRGKEWGHVSCHFLNLISLHQCFLVGFLFKISFLSQVAN